MRTKDKILAEALRQFNERGAEAVSIRNIADAIGISAGNLTYHFKNTDAIEYELYLQLAAALDANVAKTQHRDINLETMAVSAKQTFQKLYQYRFLLIDFVHIARRNQPLHNHFLELLELRRLQFRFVFTMLKENGLFRSDISDEDYQELSEILIVYSNAWISDGLLRFSGPEVELVERYSLLFFRMVLPYLTPKGLESYKEVIQAWESGKLS